MKVVQRKKLFIDHVTFIKVKGQIRTSQKLFPHLLMTTVKNHIDGVGCLKTEGEANKCPFFKGHLVNKSTRRV